MNKAAHIKREWLAATYGALRRQMQQAWYMAKCASILKPWSGTAHNKREGLERYLVLQARMTSNLVLQAIEQKYALHRNMKSSIREICLFLKALKQNSQFQAWMTWFILRSSKHLNKTALTAETLDAAYEKYASFVKPEAKGLTSRADHVKQMVFLDPLSETAFRIGICSMREISLFRHARKWSW